MILVSSCSCLCPIISKPCVKSRYSRSSADKRCSNYIWVINNVIAYWDATYIRGLTVSITRRIVIIKSEVSTFPIDVIFFRGCVSEVVVSSYAVGFSHIYTCISRENCVLRHQLLCGLMMCANNRLHYDRMVVYGYLHITLPHYHHYADLLEYIELLQCSADILCLECVSKIRSVLSIILHVIYGAVCTQLNHAIPVLHLIVIKSKVWPICRCLGLGHETMVLLYVSLYSYNERYCLRMLFSKEYKELHIA